MSDFGVRQEIEDPDESSFIKGGKQHPEDQEEEKKEESEDIKSRKQSPDD
jgi:hypothetical protein